MGKKKQSQTHQLITFGMAASEDALSAAIESLQAVKESRFPSAATKTTRKPRSDKGKPRDAQTVIPGTEGL